MFIIDIYILVNIFMSIKLTNNQYPGHLLVANPSNPLDELSKGVILLVSHTASLAIGIQINAMMTHMTLATVSDNIGLDITDPRSRLDVPLHYGGMHGAHRVQVIHTSDWKGLTTVEINKDLCITNDISILAALSVGDGPSQFRPCAGFVTWEDNGLDHQLDNRRDNETHRWEIAPGAADVVFDYNEDEQWRQSLFRAAHFTTAQWF
jgi:putative transcriptional regulator